MMKHLLLALLLIASAAHGEIYTWKDARGTEFYTNSLDEIPARYLKKARVLDVATGKKGPLATALPASVPGAAASSSAPAQPAAVPTMPVQAPSVAAPPVAATEPPPVAPAQAEVSSPRERPSRESRSQRRPRRRDVIEEE